MVIEEDSGILNVNGLIKKEERCDKCDTPESRVRLFDGVEGIDVVRICEDCAKLDGIPIIKKPSADQLREAEKPYTVYERLYRVAGLPSQQPRHFNKDKEVHLDDLKKRVPQFALSKPLSLKLVENFNWKIMRSRRGKRLSQKQLAELLFESEEAIKMLENGKIPENAEKLILKLEQYFQITLNLEPKKEKKAEDIRFDKYTINRFLMMLSQT